jgi:hypothetical protein
MQQLIIKKIGVAASLVYSIAIFSPATSTAQTSPMPSTGAIFTTDYTCNQVNGNIYLTKQSVFLNGGPEGPKTAGLPPLQSFYVQVTDPSGKILLGSSGSSKPVTTDSFGKFTSCLELDRIVKTASSNLVNYGYDDSPNNGDEYKVWVSTDATFASSDTKTDNFKVVGPTLEPGTGAIQIRKFYDANLNGVMDPGEPEMLNDANSTNGWLVDILNANAAPQYTVANYLGLSLANGTADGVPYVVREYRPVQPNWYATGAAILDASNNPSLLVSGSKDLQYLNQATLFLSSTIPAQTVWFGNVCTGGGYGYTLGYWSNKNGQAAITQYIKDQKISPASSFYSGLQSLKLVGNKYSQANPYQSFTSYTDLANFLLGATATNMANMLSAQLLTMYLNTIIPVKNSSGSIPPTTQVSLDALIYAPGTKTGNQNYNFATVRAIIQESIDELSIAANTWTPSGAKDRYYQESLKNALDNANNNRTFLMPSPDKCLLSFPVSTATP